MIRFFVDECLSAKLAAVAKGRGLQADFGPHIGTAGWQDWNIARFAFENDYIVVTNNRRHFLREFRKYEVHNGLVVIVPMADRDRQIELFQRALDCLLELNELPLNKLIEVLDDGSVHIREWSSQEGEAEHVLRPSWTR